MDNETKETQVKSEEGKEKVYNAEVVKEKEEKASGLAITALILGILSFCCCGLFAGIPAIVVGWIENNNIKAGKSPESGKWMAIVGIILGLWSLLWTCLWVGWYFFYGGMAILSSLRPF
ncbi:MAG: DUF4190 domain-containing protein [Acidobacteriota bacterium]